jgi:haloacetate dehalogenase
MDMNVDVNGINLHYLDEGEGAPVLMLHGFPDSSRAWRHQIPPLT